MGPPRSPPLPLSSITPPHRNDAGKSPAPASEAEARTKRRELGFRECSLAPLGKLRRNVSWSAAEPYPPGEQEARPPWWQCDRF